MLLWIGILLLAIWLLFVIFIPLLGVAIHLALIVAVVLIVLHLLRGRPTFRK